RGPGPGAPQEEVADPVDPDARPDPGCGSAQPVAGAGIRVARRETVDPAALRGADRPDLGEIRQQPVRVDAGSGHVADPSARPVATPPSSARPEELGAPASARTAAAPPGEFGAPGVRR